MISIRYHIHKLKNIEKRIMLDPENFTNTKKLLFIYICFLTPKNFMGDYFLWFRCKKPGFFTKSLKTITIRKIRHFNSS
jgi:hypothetical protein